MELLQSEELFSSYSYFSGHEPLYYLFDFRETQRVTLEFNANITEQTGTVTPSGERTRAYAEQTLVQISRSDEVDLPHHSSGRKLQVPILPNTFSCNM